MKIEKDAHGMFVIHASDSELTIINNALNEICNGLPLHDFETRVGVPLSEIELLLTLIGKTLSQQVAH